jgi:hypothetical protein
MLDLQRAAGNQAVVGEFRRARNDVAEPGVQRLAVDDLFETVSETVSGVVDTITDAVDTAVTGIAGLGNPTLRKGSKGAAVKRLQKLLVTRGAALAEDGDFGSSTDSAVRNFQTDHGLTIDGIAGTMTWGQLIRGGDADADSGQRRKDFAKASVEDKADWALLGGTPDHWNDGDSPGLQGSTSFTDLSDAQKAAAVRLGYTKESWNTGLEGTADQAAEEYGDEEAKGSKKSGGALPAKWAGSLRSRAILDAEFGHLKSIDMPKVVLLTPAATKTKYESFHGKGSYPTGGLEGFEVSGTNYLNMGSQSADTVIHEMLHTQEHSDWDKLAYVGETSIGEGATEMLTKRAANRFEIPVSTSYAAEHALVSDMNRHSSQAKMMNAYFRGGGDVTTYQTDVESGLKTGKVWADFKGRIDAKDIPGARAMLT